MVREDVPEGIIPEQGSENEYELVRESRCRERLSRWREQKLQRNSEMK